MMVIIIYLICTLLLCLALTLTLIFVSNKSEKDREKHSPFECGFDPQNSPRIPFSIQFFMITIIFLIFDVEIVLLIPLPLISLNTNSTNLILMSSTLFIILIFGLLHEWINGELSWVK